MYVIIFDVSHGFCAYLEADNGTNMLIDCGHNERTGFRPSDYLRNIGRSVIDYLLITNLDQDHVSDLPNLRGPFPIGALYRNLSISPEQLRGIKRESGPITTAMELAIEMIGSFSGSGVRFSEATNIEFNWFHNSYPEFTDTNNLSVVAFVHFDGMGIVFPGDLERAGWMKLLENSQFQNNLGRTNIFIASHHGRVDGYCNEVFQHCSPDIVIISDKEITHDTQKNIYVNHASGVPWDDGSTRYVLTTRADADIVIEKQVGTSYQITI